jgi:hypothetical protein
MRDVVGQSVAEIDVAGLKQEVDRVGADRADRVAVALPRQREPAGRFAARDVGKDLGRARNARSGRRKFCRAAARHEPSADDVGEQKQAGAL